MKYPYQSSLAGKKSKFGFFATEIENFDKIASELGIIRHESVEAHYARHPLVYLVEAADDICYQLMDIEDAHKLRILSTADVFELLLAYLDEKRIQSAKEVFKTVTDANEQIAYLRSIIIGILVGQVSSIFVENEESILRGTLKKDLVAYLPETTKKAYESCQKTAFDKIYRSKEVADIELAGYKIIRTLLDYYIEAVQSPQKTYSRLLIDKVPTQYDMRSDDINIRVQAVLDFISGMTDVYALDLFRKINGHSLPAI